MAPALRVWALKSVLAPLSRLEMEPLFPAHGALLSLISGPNATADNLETASRAVWVIGRIPSVNPTMLPRCTRRSLVRVLLRNFEAT